MTLLILANSTLNLVVFCFGSQAIYGALLSRSISHRYAFIGGFICVIIFYLSNQI